MESCCSAETVTVSESVKLMLFTTKTCPNCKLAKAVLDKAGIEYEVIDAEEREDLVKKFDVRQAPTLVAVAGDGYQKFANASNIKKFVEMQ